MRRGDPSEQLSEELDAIPDPFEEELLAPVPSIDVSALGTSPTRSHASSLRAAAAVLSVLYELGLLLALGARWDLAELPLAYAVAGALFPLAIAIGFLVFGLGTAESLWTKGRAIALVVLLAAATFIAGTVLAERVLGTARVVTWRWPLKCFGLSAAFAIGPLILALIAFRHAFVARSAGRGAVLGAAAGAVAAAALSLHCPNILLVHILVGHGLPILAAAGILSLLARRFWRA